MVDAAEYNEYRLAFGRRKLELHLRIFYTVRPGWVTEPHVRMAEHPILVGTLPRGWVTSQVTA